MCFASFFILRAANIFCTRLMISLQDENNGQNTFYDTTICSSKQESLRRAIDLLYEELETREKPPMIRPRINWKSMILTLMLWLLPIAISTVFALTTSPLRRFGIWIVAIAVIVSSGVFMKRLLIDAILLYQRYAPERIRKRCVFEPTCSNYMMQAIEKYGVIRGVWKGCRRLLRCHYPNGGVDNP